MLWCGVFGSIMASRKRAEYGLLKVTIQLHIHTNVMPIMILIQVLGGSGHILPYQKNLVMNTHKLEHLQAAALCETHPHTVMKPA